MAKVKIEHQNIIFCEGMDAKMFLIWYLNSQALSGNPIFANDIQVIDFGGNQELPKQLELLKITPGFEIVKSLLIIRDAEQDVVGAVSEIQDALKKCNFSVPKGPAIVENGMPKVGFLLFPTCDTAPTEGALENLCYTILNESSNAPVFQEIDQFLQGLEDKNIRSYPRKFKTSIHTYLSVTDKYVSLKIGEAAKAGAFNWEHDNLIPLKDFMLTIFS